ncbi:Nudix family hydrolase [Thiobacillus sp. 0-1251]|uniref:Nudix family hydrolase n=1 Tax=Thiobacillus sp. 0-1251 TaxID=1895858 RepID=UPI000959CA30|nr:Nudix family hydrolase [Thiobacillus sp. 0-1251]OJY57389.1 MAG: DNA mismatch repair protein MutT [Thiobacillus sp. 0-1251]
MSSVPITEVAAAVLTQPDGRVLLARRPAGKAYAGYWEFPGGKVEPGESLDAALARELHEELGIVVTRACRWITRVFEYPHATVRLNFFRVFEWQGTPHPHEGQVFSWQLPDAVEVTPLLPANFPIVKALSLPTVLGISHAESLGVDTFLARLDVALHNGLRLIQLRDKTLPEETRLQLARETVRRAHLQGARVLVNGPLELAHAAGADGIHLDSSAAARLTARPDCEWVGVSCHDGAELVQAAALGADFALLSPVLPTLTHPGAATLGWDAFSTLAAASPIPVYGLGGLGREDVALAQSHGAHGVALLRGAWT